MKNNATRKLLDSSFTAVSKIVLVFLILAVVVFIVPIAVKGVGAFLFTATVEHDKFCVENLDHDLTDSVRDRISSTNFAREKLYRMMGDFESGKVEQAEEIRSKRKCAMDALIAKSLELGKICAMDANSRTEAFGKISSDIFGDYVESIVKAANASGGSAYTLQRLVRDESDLFSENLKKVSDSIALTARISAVRKSSMKRNLSLGVIEKLKELNEMLSSRNAAYNTFKSGVAQLLGPINSEDKSAAKLMRQKYGQTRLDLAQRVYANSVQHINVKDVDSNGTEIQKKVLSSEFFAGTPVGKMCEYIDKNFELLLAPHFTFYPGFFTDNPVDANIFGGIFPMITGTFYLTLGAMLIAAPLGIIAAIYFSEYSHGGKIVSILEMCVGTLAGVPSIVFGLFGLAFLINTVKLSDGKSVLAGAVTLALLILPTIIRSCQESLKAVPNQYREAAYGLGAGKWRAICGVILPAALPSMLTGIIISMGRAAGETAPIIFTAATSTGVALGLSDIFSQPTPALPWNIYNICSEHEMVERVEHVQYGMVLTLMIIVLSLNFIAILVRARLQSKHQ